MSNFDLNAFLTEISPQAPCGEDISYDINFMELERLVQSTDETQVKKGDWEEVCQRSLKLFERSKDLRLIIYLTLSKLCLEGLQGFHDGLALLSASVDRYWDHLFPQLDPDDDNDPMERLNIISALSPVQSVMSDQDSIKFIPRLMDMAICKPNDNLLPHPSLKHLLVASGEISPVNKEDYDYPTMQLIDAAFEQTDIQDLLATDQLLRGCKDQLNALDQLLVDRVGANKAPSFNRLEQVLNQIQAKTGMYLERRGYGPKMSLLSQTQKRIKSYISGKQTEQDNSKRDNKQMKLPDSVSSSDKISGQILSNQDVLKTLDMIILYYEQNEPSSPVPLLLKRAKGLVGRSFVDIVRNISPDAMTQIRIISGEDGSADN